MDEKDQLLLTALRRDARRPLVALARDIGLSRSATQDRLNRLLRSGAISGFTTVEPAGSTGKVATHFLVTHAPGGSCAKLMPHLEKIPGISRIHALAGPIDLVIFAEAADMAGIEAIRAAIDALPSSQASPPTWFWNVIWGRCEECQARLKAMLRRLPWLFRPPAPCRPPACSRP